MKRKLPGILLVAILVLVAVFSLSACGAEKVKQMVAALEQGIMQKE